MVEEKTHILDSAAAEHPDERGPFGGGLGAAGRQLRGEQLGVIESGDQIAVTGQVRGQKGGGEAVAAAMVGKNDKRESAGLRGIPDFASEEAVAPRVARFDGADSDGE